MRGKRHGQLHVVGDAGETNVVRSYSELSELLNSATDIIVRQRRIIEALKRELERRDDSPNYGRGDILS